MTSVAISPHSTPLPTSEPPTTRVADTDASSVNPSSKKKEEDDEKWIWVLDPMTRKLRVPVNLLNPTQATATSGTVPSLCIAYLEGRCRHPWCRQAHVMPSAIPQLRYEALNAPTCCHMHNDPHDISKLTNRFRYIRIVNNGASGDSELIPTERVAATVGLLRYLVHNILPKKNEEDARKKEGQAGGQGSAETKRKCSTGADGEPVDEDSVLELPAKFICRLHLAHRCRYLEDCNNIHLCREYELQLQPPPHMLGSLSSVTTSTRTITVGDACYSVTPLAVGDVTDEDFAAISEAQKIHHQNSIAASTPAVLWADARPFDSAVHSTAGNSPMLYSQGGAETPLSGPATTSGALFPSMPDYWQPPSALGSAMPGNSPCLSSTPALDRSAMSQSTAGHLRVYDVRPKPTGAASHAASSGSGNGKTVTSPVHSRSSSGSNHAITPPANTTAAATTAAACKPTSPSSVVGGQASRNEAPCAGGGNTHPSTTGKTAPVIYSSINEGGISFSTSGANTPVNDGAYPAFLQRIVDASAAGSS